MAATEWNGYGCKEQSIGASYRLSANPASRSILSCSLKQMPIPLSGEGTGRREFSASYDELKPLDAAGDRRDGQAGAQAKAQSVSG